MMLRKLTMGIAATAMALGLGAATSASAAMTLAGTDLSCDLYSAAGCLFNYDNGDGDIFDDPAAFEGAYNGSHIEGPNPATIDLTYLGKIDFSNGGASEAVNPGYLVSFYAVKSGSGQVILFGLNPADDSFTAVNTRIKNQNDKFQGISHVTFFGNGDGTGTGTGGGVPEPATWAMMIIGFGGVGSVIRRRRMMAA